MTQANTQANVQIIRFAHFYNEGTRGAAGNAPQNDKVWGIAKVNNTLVNFWGRRNGVLKFKTRFLSEMSVVQAKYEEKIGGRKTGDVYTAVSNPAMMSMLCPKLEADVSKHYYSAMSLGKLNTKH